MLSSKIANELTYLQRKALRRIGRGQSISGKMTEDPLVSQFYVIEIPPMPSGEDLNIVSYCDWEVVAMNSARSPKITEFGRSVLDALDGNWVQSLPLQEPIVYDKFDPNE